MEEEKRVLNHHVPFGETIKSELAEIWKHFAQVCIKFLIFTMISVVKKILKFSKNQFCEKSPFPFFATF